MNAQCKLPFWYHFIPHTLLTTVNNICILQRLFDLSEITVWFCLLSLLLLPNSSLYGYHVRWHKSYLLLLNAKIVSISSLCLIFAALINFGALESNWKHLYVYPRRYTGLLEIRNGKVMIFGSDHLTLDIVCDINQKHSSKTAAKLYSAAWTPSVL